MRQSRKKSAYTFVEMIVSAIILTFIIASILAVLNVGDKMWHSEIVMGELQQNVRLAIDGMAREIRQTTNINAPAAGANAASISIDLSGASDDIEYSLNGSNQIIREHPAGTNKILAHNIVSLDFDRVDGNNVIINVQASKTFKGRVLTFSLSEKVRLRN